MKIEIDADLPLRTLDDEALGKIAFRHEHNKNAMPLLTLLRGTSATDATGFDPYLRASGPFGPSCYASRASNHLGAAGVRHGAGWGALSVSRLQHSAVFKLSS